MGLDSAWYFPEVAALRSAAGPLPPAPPAEDRTPLPDRSDIGFWLGLQSTAARSPKLAKLVAYDDVASLVADGTLDPSFRLDRAGRDAWRSLVAAATQERAQRKERDNVAKALGRGRLPEGWQVLSSRHVAILPDFVRLIRADMDEDPYIAAASAELLEAPVFRRFLDVLGERRPGPRIWVGVTR